MYDSVKLSDWTLDPGHIREYVALATAEGFRPSSIDQGRSILFRYTSFLQTKLSVRFESAGWREFGAYKGYLAQQALSKTSIRNHMSYVLGYYRLRAQASQDPALMELYSRMKAVGAPRRAKSEKWRPLSLETLNKVLEGARKYGTVRVGFREETSEDYPFLMTLLYTGGRAQFYGLRVSDISFDGMEIKTKVKGGKPATIPLHPKLAQVLRDHLQTRGYDSEFLFRRGRDVESRTGQKANRQNAWRACKRAQKAANLAESIHPHRFRKTLATLGKRLGLDPQYLQAILAHESVTITLDVYAEVDMDDVKRQFAQVDLQSGSPPGRSEVETRELLSRLERIANQGDARSRHDLVEALLDILGGQTNGSRG